ncbi:MAG: carbohydrate ABC transporter permease [Deltaproteobacteria bacterium]|nr:carbohydrate ABC transporter permease [Deltaproteobacteria bacterium]MBW2121904.1 carbohydrate ABC transporter permease [Deltaproteobacteria bacterium]
MRARDSIVKVLDQRATPYVVVGVILFFMLIPIGWTFITSLKSLKEAFLTPPTYVPRNPTFEAYKAVIFKSPVPRYILNSLIYCLSTVAFILTAGVFSAYGLSKYPYRGSNLILVSFLVTRILPPLSLLLPFYIIFRVLGLIDTKLSVIIFAIYLSYPLAVWILKSFFDTFPSDLMDAGMIDGCTRMGVLFRIVLPGVATGIAAVAIIAFLWTWQEFLSPYLFLNSDINKPITVGVYYFVGDELTYWNTISAAAIFASIPGIVFFLIAQKYIVKGLTMGGVKG